jgi:tetratricopeptide (TPR) repeat protein
VQSKEFGSDLNICNRLILTIAATFIIMLGIQVGDLHAGSVDRLKQMLKYTHTVDPRAADFICNKDEQTKKQVRFFLNTTRNDIEKQLRRISPGTKIEDVYTVDMSKMKYDIIEKGKDYEVIKLSGSFYTSDITGKKEEIKSQEDDIYMMVSERGNWYSCPSEMKKTALYKKMEADLVSKNKIAEQEADKKRKAEEYSDNGARLLLKKDYDAALSALKEAEALDPNNPLIHYNLACAYSLKGNVSQGLNELDEALGKGFASNPKRHDSLKKDPDLDNLRKSKEWRQILLKNGLPWFD